MTNFEWNMIFLAFCWIRIKLSFSPFFQFIDKFRCYFFFYNLIKTVHSSNLLQPLFGYLISSTFLLRPSPFSVSSKISFSTPRNIRPCYQFSTFNGDMVELFYRDANSKQTKHIYFNEFIAPPFKNVSIWNFFCLVNPKQVSTLFQRGKRSFFWQL